MERYNTKAKCPKCGSEKVKDNYHKGKCPVWTFEQVSSEEHIHRTCQGCGYEWAEKPLDKGKE